MTDPNPRISIVYDKFLVRGGGERVCDILIEAFPQARIYALNAYPREYWENRLGRKVETPIFGFLFMNKILVGVFYPLALLLMSSLRIKADIVIVYSSTVGKFVRLDCKKRYLYSNYPNRLLYQPWKMITNKVILLILNPFIKIMALLDKSQFKRYHYIYSISESSRKALLDFAKVDSNVLFPPFDERGITSQKVDDDPRIRDYFLVVSRLEPEKEIEYVITTFSRLGHKLRVVGDGSLFSKLSKKEFHNIKYLGYIDDKALAAEYAGAKALIFPSDIEYSLVPLEAAFLGTPTIGLRTQATEDILTEEVNSDSSSGNAVLYDSKSPESLSEAICRFENITWDRNAIRKSCENFSRQAFIKQIQSIVLGKTTRPNV